MSNWSWGSRTVRVASQWDLQLVAHTAMRSQRRWLKQIMANPQQVGIGRWSSLKSSMAEKTDREMAPAISKYLPHHSLYQTSTKRCNFQHHSINHWEQTKDRFAARAGPLLSGHIGSSLQQQLHNLQVLGGNLGIVGTGMVKDGVSVVVDRPWAPWPSSEGSGIGWQPGPSFTMKSSLYIRHLRPIVVPKSRWWFWSWTNTNQCLTIVEHYRAFYYSQSHYV